MITNEIVINNPSHLQFFIFVKDFNVLHKPLSQSVVLFHGSIEYNYLPGPSSVDDGTIHDNARRPNEVKSSQVKSPLIKTSDNRTSKHANT